MHEAVLNGIYMHAHSDLMRLLYAVAAESVSGET